MAVPSLNFQIPTTPSPQSPAAAVPLLRPTREALAAKLGQALPATVLGTDSSGLTQLKIGDVTVAVKLSQPLPARTQIQVEVQPAPNGTVALSVQPRVLPQPLAP